MCIQLHRDFQSSLISVKLKLKGYKIENYTVKDEIAVSASKQKQHVHNFPLHTRRSARTILYKITNY